MVRPLDRACRRRIPDLMRRGGAGRNGGGATRLQVAEAGLNATAPKVQYNTGAMVLDGSGNVASIPNRRGSGSLVLTAGTLTPTVGTNFGGRPKLVFSGGQYLDSNDSTAFWKFCGDGLGCTMVHVYRVASAPGTARILSTTTSGPNGMQLSVEGADLVRHRVFNSVGNVFDVIDSVADLADTYMVVQHSTASPLARASSVRDRVFSSGAYSNAANNVNADRTFRLGAAIGGVAPYVGEWVETIAWDRVLPEWDLQLVREYIAARYGIAAPLVTGDDRDILSMVPFAGPRADYYSLLTGKVTSWLDRSRPGHTFAQATGGNQVATPSPDAALLNALSAPFLGGQYYASNLPALAWKFIHDGTGFEAYDVFVPTNPSATSLIWGTYNPGPAGQMQCGAANVVAFAAYAAAGIGSVNDSGAAVLGARTISRLAMASAASPQLRLRVNGRTEQTSAIGTPSASAPPSTMRLGTRGDLALPLQARWAETLWFARVLSTDERARVANYLMNRYGGVP